ncbi:MAG: hypothetical protein FWG89_08000 [Treponema sp.]|nr:hypothetical protein [Treponema sp.]
MQRRLGLIFGIIGVAFLFLGCFSTAVPAAPISDGISELIVQRANTRFASNLPMNVYLNGELQFSVDNAESGNVMIPNGQHTVNFTIGRIESGNLAVTANSNQIAVLATPKSGFFRNTINLVTVTRSDVSIRPAQNDDGLAGGTDAVGAGSGGMGATSASTTGVGAADAGAVQ